MIYLQNLSATYKFTKYMYIMIPRCYLLSLVSVYELSELNYSFRNVYNTVFVFIMWIWVNSKTTQKWGSEDICFDENWLSFRATILLNLSVHNAHVPYLVVSRLLRLVAKNAIYRNSYTLI